MTPSTLIQRYLLGIASEAEVLELEELLISSVEFKREFVLAAQMDVVGRNVAIEQSIRSDSAAIEQELDSNKIQSSFPRQTNRLGWLLGLAATILFVFLLWPRSQADIATIVSSENAAWESSLPTRPGDPLTAGILNLKTGLATIRFSQGAELVLEAPAKLELISDMRCRLDSGAAVVNVPKSAKGFVVESPGGYAEDFGTQFAIRVDDDRKSDIELIEGEIEVHHSQSGRSLRLRDNGAAVIVSDESIRRIEKSEAGELGGDTPIKPHLKVIGTNGRCGTAMPRFKKRSRYIDPAILSVKRSISGEWDYRSFFSFDISDVDFDRVSDVRLRLNLVPSHRGHVSRLPKVNRFGVYGLTNKGKANWKIESTWEESPGPEDGVLLGTFNIQRSQARGVFGIDGTALRDFLEERRSNSVTLILVRETSAIAGVGPGLTHMFAGDSHPESVGPQLEFTLQ